MYNYEEFLTRKLNTIKTELGYEDLTLEIATEQAFSKKKNLLPNTVYIVIKYLTADISYGAVAQPIQILCLSEQNILEKTKPAHPTGVLRGKAPKQCRGRWGF